MNMREVLEAMRLNGLHDEAAAVGIVMQQRAELLEALKEISGIACMNFQEDSDIQDIYEISSAAITRAAAEIGKAMP